MDVASIRRIREGELPRLRFSRVVWLVLLSQVLSLGVVTTALWDLRNNISQIPGGMDAAFSQRPPESLAAPSTGDPNRIRPTLLPPRIIGETNQILECITNAFQVSRREANRGEAVRQEAVRQEAVREQAAREEDNREDVSPEDASREEAYGEFARWDTAIDSRWDGRSLFSTPSRIIGGTFHRRS